MFNWLRGIDKNGEELSWKTFERVIDEICDYCRSNDAIGINRHGYGLYEMNLSRYPEAKVKMEDAGGVIYIMISVNGEKVMKTVSTSYGCGDTIIYKKSLWGEIKQEYKGIKL